MTEMGWINAEDAMLTLANETVQEDISSLPSEVADNLTGPEVEMCVAKIQEGAMKYFAKYWYNLSISCLQPFLPRCVADYTEPELALITSLVNGVANFDCIKHSLAKSCNVFVSDVVRTMLGLPTDVLGEMQAEIYSGIKRVVPCRRKRWDWGRGC